VPEPEAGALPAALLALGCFAGCAGASLEASEQVGRKHALDDPKRSCLNCHPFYAPICDAVLGPSCARCQLNVAQVMDRGPGAEQQILHRGARLRRDAGGLGRRLLRLDDACRRPKLDAGPRRQRHGDGRVTAALS